MMRTTSKLVAVVVAMGLLSVASAQTPGITDKTILLGVFAPLSGPFAHFGVGSVAAQQMVYDRVNREGGVHGRQIEIVREDDQCAVDVTVGAVRKLIERPVFALVGGYCTGGTLAAKKIIEEAGVPFVGHIAGEQLVAPFHRAIFATVVPTSQTQAGAALAFAASRGAKTYAVLRATDAYGKEAFRGLELHQSRHGLTLVADESMERDATDASAQVLRIRRANPDAVILPIYNTPAAVFLRQAQELGLRPKVFVGFLAASFPQIVQQAPGTALESFYGMNPLADVEEGPGLESYREEFKKNFPSIAAQPGEPNWLAIMSGVSAEVVVEALRRAGKDLTRDKFIAGLETINNYQSKLAASPVRLSPTDHNGAHGVKFWRYDTQKKARVTLPEYWAGR